MHKLNIIAESLCTLYAMRNDQSITQHPIAILTMSLITGIDIKKKIPDMICTEPSMIKTMQNGTYRQMSVVWSWQFGLFQHIFRMSSVGLQGRANTSTQCSQRFGSSLIYNIDSWSMCSFDIFATLLKFRQFTTTKRKVIIIIKL